MTAIKWLNFIFAVVGLTSGIYLIYSVTMRTITRKIETEFGKMEKNIMDKLNSKSV